MVIDFTTRSPWKDITELTVDGCAVVRIPKFYYKVTGDYSSTITRRIADRATTGYAVHPAFMHNGVERDYFDYFAYEAYNNGGKAGSACDKVPWTCITMGQAITACNALGNMWHLQNIYEHSAIAMLMLIELGTPDVQAAIGSGNSSSKSIAKTGSTNAVWRGLHEFWGNTYEWCDGIYTNGNGISILKNDGSGTYINVNKSLKASGIPFSATLLDKGDGYDFGSIFVPASSGSNEVYPDWGYVDTSVSRYLFVSGDCVNNNSCGAFTFTCQNTLDSTYVNNSFRACRYAP